MSARLGILLSGTGSTYVNLVDAIAKGELSADIAIVISSREEAEGLKRAKEFGHPATVAKSSDEVTAALRSARVDWVVMCGYLKFWDPPSDFAGKTINIHPSLLPAFGGPGMYGSKVHEAVLKAGCAETGCTVHLVCGGYDSGPILAQIKVPIRSDDTVASLQERVQAAERALYPKAIAALITGRRQ